MIVINFKTYLQATGKKAVELARICYEVAEETGIKVAIGLQATDIFRVASEIKIPIFAQHADSVKAGKNTGLITAAALKRSGAVGVFFNHSEHPFFSFSSLEKAVKLTKKENLESLVFVKDIRTAIKVNKFKPEYIVLEEPDMVGGDVSMVSFPQYHKIIREFIKSINSIPLIGAGVKTKEDVFNSLKIGIKGVVLASGFVKAEDPKKVLLNLASAF